MVVKITLPRLNSWVLPQDTWYAPPPPHQVDVASADQVNCLPRQVEGVEPSEDPVLQSRLFAYPGTL